MAAMDIIGDSVGSGNEVGLVELVFSDRLQLDNKKHPKLNKHLKANSLTFFFIVNTSCQWHISPLACGSLVGNVGPLGNG